MQQKLGTYSFVYIAASMLVICSILHDQSETNKYDLLYEPGTKTMIS